MFMMVRIERLAIGFGLAVLAVGLLAAAQHDDKQKADVIAGYRSWKKINPKPIYMAPIIAARCVQTWPPDSDPSNPHVPNYFTVYVNPVGEKAMLSRQFAKFPEGSVIVKEKLEGSDEHKVKLLTVMIKRHSGFAPAIGDWQFLVVDGKDSKKRSSAGLKHCESCHHGEKKDDYVFRTYVKGFVHAGELSEELLKQNIGEKLAKG